MTAIHQPQGGSYCDILTRRSFMRVGGMALGGMSIGLGDVLRLQAASRDSAAPRARSIIMIFLSGGPSHLDMYDMKPLAPREYRGEFNPIRTNVPGIEICELMPQQAKIADKFTILRGCKLSHLHTANEFYSGYPWQESPRASLPDEAQRPAIGSVDQSAARRRSGHSAVCQPGQPAGLGTLVLRGRGTRAVSRRQRQPREALANMGRLPEVNVDRMVHRSSLLHAFDAMRRDFDSRGSGGFDAFQNRALEIVTAGKVRDAFDLEKEPAEMRARYGDGPFQRRHAPRAHAVASPAAGRGGRVGRDRLFHHRRLGYAPRQLQDASPVPAAARPGPARADHRPGKPRHAGRHADPDGRRVWSHAAHRRHHARRTQPLARRRVPVGCWRRRDAPARLSAPPTPAAKLSWASQYRRKTCWPRSTRCWGSTRGSRCATTMVGRSICSKTASRSPGWCDDLSQNLAAAKPAS